jgi:hypothetical protein
MNSRPIPRWHTREDSGLVLDPEGRWWHDGEPIEHPRIVATFDAGLRPTEDGRFKLVVGNDWCFVEVQGAAFRVLDAWAEGDAVELRLSDGSTEPLHAEGLETDPSGVLICRVKDGRALARFSRLAQLQVGEMLELEQGTVWLRNGAHRSATSVDPQILDASASSIEL